MKRTRKNFKRGRTLRYLTKKSSVRYLTKKHQKRNQKMHKRKTRNQRRRKLRGGGFFQALGNCFSSASTTAASAAMEACPLLPKFSLIKRRGLALLGFSFALQPSVELATDAAASPAAAQAGIDEITQLTEGALALIDAASLINIHTDSNEFYNDVEVFNNIKQNIKQNIKGQFAGDFILKLLERDEVKKLFFGLSKVFNVSDSLFPAAADEARVSSKLKRLKDGLVNLVSILTVDVGAAVGQLAGYNQELLLTVLPFLLNNIGLEADILGYWRNKPNQFIIYLLTAIIKHVESFDQPELDPGFRTFLTALADLLTRILSTYFYLAGFTFPFLAGDADGDITEFLDKLVCDEYNSTKLEASELPKPPSCVQE